MKRTIAGPYGSEDVDLTKEEIEARQAEEAQPLPPPPILDQLKTIFTSLPTETQADLGPLAAAVYMFLDQNNPEAAKLVIERAQVPKELDELRAALLSKFG